MEDIKQQEEKLKSFIYHVRQKAQQEVIRELYMSATLYSDGSATLMRSYLERKYPDIITNLTQEKHD